MLYPSTATAPRSMVVKMVIFQPGIQKKHGENKGFASNLDGYLSTDVDIRGYHGVYNEYDQT